MRILSARVVRAHRDRGCEMISALVVLLVLREDAAGPERVEARVAVPAFAPDGAPLRERLLASAKLAHAAARAGRRAA